MSAPPAKPKQSSRWGSLLQGAVAGIESRLDTILADDGNASAKGGMAQKAVPQTGRPRAGSGNMSAQAKTADDASRSSSRSRPSGRLQDRLAKAVASNQRSGSQTPSEVPSPVLSPALASEPTRTSFESRVSSDLARPAPQESATQGEESDEPTRSEVFMALSSSYLPINPSAASVPSPRLSTDSNRSKHSLETPDRAVTPALPLHEANGLVDEAKSSAEYEAEIAQMRHDYMDAETRRQEEMHQHLERIDALQAKLQYLAKESIAASRQAASSEPAGSIETKLAEKDEQIAQLMAEGQNLSKTELKHMTTIRKLRAKLTEEDKAAAELRKRLARVEKNAAEATERAGRAEADARQAGEKMKQLGRIERDIEMLRAERDEAASMIASLRKNLADVTGRAEEAERKAQTDAIGAERKLVVKLQDDLSNARIERKLADDRARVEIQRVKEEAEKRQERASITDMELRSEISNLESKIEFLRARTEEASSNATGDSQAKLLRQVETLQSQYSLASENWQSIEGSLIARVSALQHERDEAIKREADIRKKARDVNTKSRRLEEELEGIKEQLQSAEKDVETQRAEVRKLQQQVEQSQAALSTERADFNRERRVWQADFQQRLEEEQLKWRRESSSHIGDPNMHYLRTESPTTLAHRKQSSVDPLTIHTRRSMNRTTSYDHSNHPLDRPVSRRTSIYPRTPGTPGTPEAGTPDRQSSTISLTQLISNNRHHSYANPNNIPPTPSVHTVDADDPFENRSSPERTINDVVSASTAAAGPSVQLVERMSAAVRRLESEKAASRDETARLLAQRDEARAEVVALMKDADEAKAAKDRAQKLEQSIDELNTKYDASLEMLGEREELVEELKADVADLKKIYRELVDSTMR
ncbi:hypothetical protein B0A49_10513 [Cryomyces minteri]|uniref:TATA element modulatory factor 1 TATA binding domain-containing protein n=1 Tax=Cryomyces minteri TaxID=331657 RepID=A0A4U0WRQ0_9PEZI|nr:hypothetical protein B0A49_10513 [Cryomyces minteri]